MCSKAIDAKTDRIRIISAVIFAPALTAAIMSIICLVIVLGLEVMEKGHIGLSYGDEKWILIAAFVVFMIGAFCSLVFALPLHLYLAKRNNMQLKYYFFVAAAMTSPLFLIYAMAGLAGIFTGLVFVFAGMLCAGLFWFIAVDNYRYPIKNLLVKCAKLFE